MLACRRRARRQRSRSTRPSTSARGESSASARVTSRRSRSTTTTPRRSHVASARRAPRGSTSSTSTGRGRRTPDRGIRRDRRHRVPAQPGRPAAARDSRSPVASAPPTPCDAILAAGADRVVLGTAALRDPAFVAAAIDRHGADRIAVALDVRDGRRDRRRLGSPARPACRSKPTRRSTHWKRRGRPDLRRHRHRPGRPPRGPGPRHSSAGGPRRDRRRHPRLGWRGLRRGPARRPPDFGCRGAIVGRAIYDGRIDLAQAIRVAQPAQPA